MLGIGIGGSKETEVDDGVAVLSVSPGGPAEKAGIKTGDVIVELNGKSLKREKDKSESPREKLLSQMGKLSPGDEVSLRYLRDGKSAIAKLKAEELPHDMARREMRYRIGPGDIPHFGPGDFNFEFEAPHILSMLRGGSFGEMELVPITPKLAQYFGTDKGLLVVRAPESKELKLEDGDVLVDIDGRVPSNPGHAFRILASYQSGEKVTLNVLRQRKKTALAVVIPEHEDHGPKVHRERIERIPLIKAPPAPPPV
jgi:S1-C subfamily serine protease